MPNVGPMELIIVLIVALLIIGPKKLPEVGRSVGRGIREFKGSIGGDDDAAVRAGRACRPSPRRTTTVAASARR